VESRSRVALCAASLAGALLIWGAPAAVGSPDRTQKYLRPPVSDGPLADGSTPTASPDHQHGGSAGHLPPTQQAMELVGELEPTGEFGDILPEQIADVAVHKGYAYLNSWDNPDCERGGTYVVDIRNPRRPREVGFIAAQQPFYHGEGAHAISIKTRYFKGDILAVNDETYGSNLAAGPCAPADKTGGGFDLYDVTNPRRPTPLVLGAGDRSPVGSTVQDPTKQFANSYHSVFVWQDGPRAYLVGSDNIEFSDVDIFDITDPRNPVFITDLDILETFPEVATEPGFGGSIFNHDMVVKRVGGQMRMLVSYWDAGYVQLDVDDPASPALITDTAFGGADPLIPNITPPQGNAHQAEYSHDNRFFLAADEDFAPYRLVERIGGDLADPQFGIGVPVTANGAPIPELQIGPGEPLEGGTRYIGNGCDPATIPPAPSTPTIAVAERGGVLPDGVTACGFENKAVNAENAGYDGLVIFNNVAPATGNRCEVLLNMVFSSPPVVDIKTVFVGRASGLRILGVFDPNTYRCVEGDVAGSTPAPPVGTEGPSLRISADFDGWGYAHLYDTNTSEEIDAFAIPEALDERFVTGFGDLSIHEFATDPEVNLAYSSYYSGGMRVFRFGRQRGLQQTGAYIDEDGSNFWGVEQFTSHGERLIAGSDRDFGLQIFRYTGPGSCQDEHKGKGRHRHRPSCRGHGR
jgi:hypothetical protein